MADFGPGSTAGNSVLEIGLGKRTSGADIVRYLVGADLSVDCLDNSGHCDGYC